MSYSQEEKMDDKTEAQKINLKKKKELRNKTHKDK